MKNGWIEVTIHILVWMVLLFLPYTFTVGVGKPWMDLFLFFWLQIFMWAAMFYLNYSYAVNRWFFHDKKGYFIVINMVVLVFFVWLKQFIITGYISIDMPRHALPFISRLYVDFFIYLIPIVIAIAIHSGKRLIKVDVLRQEADNIKLQSELQHLKYQLQPHFFFNSLNNIYALVDTDSEKAKQTIHNLSKLMRHLLQNSEAEKTLLSDEIEFLNKYISLMALRQNSEVKIETHFPKQIPNIKISPLLFVSLVENAFKHGVSATKPSWLYFELKIEGNTVTFISKNYYFPKDESDMSGSGIGIENLKKQLALLYPNKHSLLIEKRNILFEVTMSITV